MSKNMTIREYLEAFNNNEFDDNSFETQVRAGWYDWFCKRTSLRNKTYTLTGKLKQLLKSDKINQDTMYVFFKNNCPLNGILYDDFRICDMETRDVIYTVTPKSGHDSERGKAYLYGRENDFEGPIVEGTWKDIKEYFLRKD